MEIIEYLKYVVMKLMHVFTFYSVCYYKNELLIETLKGQVHNKSFVLKFKFIRVRIIFSFKLLTHP